MNIKKLGIGAASLAAVGALVLGGATFASAADTPSPTTKSSAGATNSADVNGTGKDARGQGGSQDTPVTVSYTHLDVYKRQLPGRLPGDSDVAAGEVTPVSYTHLDVYKRQGKLGLFG